MLLSRRQLNAGLFGLGVIGARSVFAESYPNRPVTIVVPYGPGGVSDVLARGLAAQLSQHFKQSFIVENRPGAAGAIGTSLVARAKPDGYTLLLGNNGSLAIAPLLRKTNSFDPMKDFTFISNALETANFLGINQSTPVTSVSQFVEWGKSQSSPLTFGSPGIGSFGHMSGELVRQGLGIQATHIPYQGTSQAIRDLLGGRLQFMVDPALIQPAFAGRIRILACAATERFPNAPEIPTFRELGFGIVSKGWQGVVGPAGLPTEIRDTLSAAVAIAAKDEGFRKLLLGIGSTPAPDSPQAFAERLRRDILHYSAVRARAGIQME